MTSPVMSIPQPFRIADGLARLPTPEGGWSVALLRHGTMQLKLYAPHGRDPQTPHKQDELYVVARGTAAFVIRDSRAVVAPGDALFAPAGVPHHFGEFSDDFATWVVFYGPDGGEKP